MDTINIKKKFKTEILIETQVENVIIYVQGSDVVYPYTNISRNIIYANPWMNEHTSL